MHSRIILLAKAVPTAAQAEAGNYNKRKLAWRGLTISIENEKGSTRRGVGPGGKPWATKMHHAYGYINRTTGSDHEQVDVYMGPELETAHKVYVVHQRKAGDWEKYDEDKCMVGFRTKADAVAAYLRQYDDPRFLGPVTTMSAERFAEKVKKTKHRAAMIKAITLVMPSGNRYALATSDYRDGAGGMLAKAIPAGARWITVHPGGSKDGKGVPVLIQESPHHKGVYHVIGGAGGKLNYLKLHGIKPKSDYKQQAKERAAARREEKKKQRQKDKEAGLTQSKKAAREQVQTQTRAKQDAFIKTVADAMGWKPEALQPKIPDTVSEAARKQLQERHRRDLLAKAHQAVELQRQHLLTDPAARDEAGIVTDSPPPRERPNEHDDSTLTVADIDDVRPASASGLGFSAHYVERAAAHGASEADIKAEAAVKKRERQAAMSDEQRTAVRNRGSLQQQIKAEVEAIRDPVGIDAKATLVDAHKAVALLKAEKALRSAEKAARTANQQIDDADSEVKAYNLEVSAPDDADVQEDLENDLRTLRTRAFLSAVDENAGDVEKTLRKHVAAGAFNAVNALAITAGGAALVDRSVVDVLGTAGAAQVLARRLATDLPADELHKLTGAMEDYHLHHYSETSQQALQRAQALQDAAKQIKLGDASHGEDFEAARALNEKRRAAVEDAHKILGTALGEMEANAALVVALKGGRNDKPLEVPMGQVSDEDAIRQARAIGLERGDYRIDRVAAQQVMTVTPVGLDRLAKPVDREELQRQHDTLDILNGGQDEDDWLPEGFARRPDLALDLKPGVVQPLAQPFAPNPRDLPQSLRDYIGGRAADGDAPADILADVQSADFYRKAGDADAYRAALDAVAPMRDKDGQIQRAESLQERFNQYADAYAARAYGGTIAPLHRQNVTPDKTAQEALFRALADEPAGIAAWKPVGELTHDDQRTLRDYFYAHVAHEDPQAAELRHTLEDADATEPEKEATDMFGETSVTPDWHAWKQRRDELAAKVNAAKLNWAKYADAMHGHVNAYATLQDLIRSGVSQSFQQAYNRLNPDAPLKIGRQVVRNNLNHLDAVDPKAREARMAQERALIDTMRNRVAGQYASGAVAGKLDAAREQRAAFDQSQMGFFSTEEAPAGDKKKPLAADERYTLGQATDRTIAGMMGTVGAQFKPGQPLKLFTPTMSGKDGIMRQRAIKLIERNKRIALAAGTGAGKTGMLLGAFSALKSKGKAKRGLFLVPSIVQGQFGAEAQRFLEPGKFQWSANPGASRAERIAAYKNPKDDFTVVTHQSFRDDMLHLGAQHAGVAPEQMAQRLDAMKPAQRAEWMRGVMEREGIHYDFSAADEAHNTLNRAGKENSSMANVIDAATANTEYFVHSTADPVKNDLSEAASLMQKLDPKRYADTDAFMRRYGVDTAGAREALQREMLPRILPFKLEPNVRADKQQITVDPNEAQKAALQALDKHVADARIARMEGKVDVDAIKALSPQSFAGKPEAEHEAIARELSRSLGIMKASAVRRVLNADAGAAKLDAVAKIAAERKGKPGVVFAHSLEAVQHIRARLEKEGHRVVTLTGADSSEDKAAKLRDFRPDKGDGKYDVLVASDAGATGANMQSGQWLAQYETPDTAMTHAQRNGRVYRIGQHNNVELIDLVNNDASARKARERLKTKYALRDLMTSPMGGLDDTGLASFLHQRNVADRQDDAA